MLLTRTILLLIALSAICMPPVYGQTADHDSIEHESALLLSTPSVEAILRVCSADSLSGRPLAVDFVDGEEVLILGVVFGKGF